MSNIETANSALADSMIVSISSKIRESNNENLERLKKQMQSMPSVLSYDTLSKLKDGEYNISLKEYTTMSTYNTMMNSMYGNNSASPFQKYLNTFLKSDEDRLADAKAFVDKMRENGLSNSSATKMYSALKTYSLVSSFKNYNFVNANV